MVVWFTNSIFFWPNGFQATVVQSLCVDHFEGVCLQRSLFDGGSCRGIGRLLARATSPCGRIPSKRLIWCNMAGAAFWWGVGLVWRRQWLFGVRGCKERVQHKVWNYIQNSRYLENWYLEADLDLEASDFWKGNFLEPKESGFREQSGFRDRGCRHGGCSLNPDYAVRNSTK